MEEIGNAPNCNSEKLQELSRKLIGYVEAMKTKMKTNVNLCDIAMGTGNNYTQSEQLALAESNVRSIFQEVQREFDELQKIELESGFDK